jgi:hypothetical protein
MKTKTRGITFALVLTFAIGILLGACGQSTPTPAPTAAPTSTPTPPAQDQAKAQPAAPAQAPNKEDKFLEQARKLAETAPAAKSNENGLLPPATENSDNVPIIQVESTELDMGLIPREGLTKREIKVHNTGKAPLEITQVSQSCGCTKASIDPDKKNVAPGGETIVTVTVDPHRIANFEATKQIYINSNDPKQPHLVINVKSKIDPEFAIDPKDVDFGDVPKGTEAEKTLIFRQLSDEPIEILQLTSLSGKTLDLQLSFEKRPEGEWQAPNHPEYKITVRLPKEIPPGSLAGSFSIQTNCKRMASFTCPVKANIVAFYTIEPARQLILRSTASSALPKTASTTVSSKQPFELLNLSASSPDIITEAKPGPDGKSQKIEVSLKPDAAPGQRSETISFTVKSGDQAFDEKLPVRVYSAKPVRPLGNLPNQAPIPGAPGQAPAIAAPANAAPVEAPKTAPVAVEPPAAPATPAAPEAAPAAPATPSVKAHPVAPKPASTKKAVKK